MRSHTSASRRASELSQASSLGLRLQSPWDPTCAAPGGGGTFAAAANSRRGSDAAGARSSPVMSHHLSRLHKKAMAAGTTPSSSLVQVIQSRKRTTFETFPHGFLIVVKAFLFAKHINFYKT